MHELHGVASGAGNPDNMLRGVGCGAHVYLLCPHHAARWLQWLQLWLRGGGGEQVTPDKAMQM